MTPDDPGAGPTLPYPPPADTPAASHGTFPSAAEALLGRLGLDADPADTAFALGRPAGPLPDVAGFEILGELGSGGMGVVYQAREVGLNRVVALKMIRPDAHPTPRDVVRFRAEAEAVAAVRHPNVVEVYSSGTAGDRPYFVMEYAAGGSLAARLAAGPLAPAEAAAVVAAVARGVHAAHEAGIVHRDIKPGNVLLCIDDLGSKIDERKTPDRHSSIVHHQSSIRPKVSDFGLAKWLDPGRDGMTRTVAVLGTPAYMAPEQARGRGKFVGPEADVYALGGVLYECLTGRPPFRDDDPLALMRKVERDAPVPPRQLVPAVHRDLDLICRKCLAKEARDRYATAAELADDLDRFLAGKPVAARPIPWPVRAARWANRNPAPAMLALTLFLVLTLGPAAFVGHRAEVKVLGADAAARAADLKLAEEKAAREAEKRAAAERVADARELVAVQGVVRRREADRPGGWTWDNAADLRRAAGLAAGNPAALGALRTEAATALLAADLRPAEPVARGFTACCAAASPDGKLVALGRFNAWGPNPKAGLVGMAFQKVAPLRVLLVDPVTGKTVRDFSFPSAIVFRDGDPAPDRVVSLAFSPDGARLYAGTRSERVVRLDVADPAASGAAAVWAAPEMPDHLVVAADGATVLGACGKQLVRWNAADGKKLAEVNTGATAWGMVVEPATGAVVAALPHGLTRAPAGTLDFSAVPDSPAGGRVRHPAVFPGGRVLAAARDATVELWDAAALRPVARFTDPDLLGQAAHADNVTAVAVHPSGAYLATASDDRVVKVWAAASGLRVAAAQLAGTGPASIAWSGDGRFLLATGVGQTARFEFAAPAAERFAGFNALPLVAAVPAADGGVIALSDFGPGDVQHLLRADAGGAATPGRELPAAPIGSRPGLAVRPGSGAVAFTSTGRGLGWWNPAGPTRELDLTPLPCRCPAYTPDGKAVWAVVDSRWVKAWDADTGAPLGPGWENFTGQIVTGLGALDALAAGRTVGVAGGADGGVHVFDPAAARRVVAPGAGDPVQAVALAPAEDVAAAGTRGGKLRLVRLADGAELPGVADAHPGGVAAVSFSADGSLLATGGRDRAVRFWVKAGAGYAPAAAVTGLPAPVRSLQFARDGGGLVVLLAGVRAARVWDTDRLRAQLGELGLGW